MRKTLHEPLTALVFPFLIETQQEHNHLLYLSFTHMKIQTQAGI